MKCKTTGTQRGCDGFTLIELLIVIMIILILGAILMTAIVTAMQKSYDKGGQAFLYRVVVAAEEYRADNQYYPGQDDPGLLKGDGGTWTGSEILAARLCGYPDGDISSNTPRAGGVDDDHKLTMYLEYKVEYVQKPAGRSYNCLLDNTNLPHALAYYPARLGANPEKVSQVYKYGDNSAHTTGAGGDPGVFNGDGYATEERLTRQEGTPPEDVYTARNPGGFLLIGTGPDDEYFTSDDYKSWEAR